MKKGFTLIELLVVVLIIGILASVAVPQYKKAVAKSRFVQLQVIGDGLAKSQEMYFMANGSYSNTALDLLDLLPQSTMIASGTAFTSGQFYCNLSNYGGEIVCIHLSDSSVPKWLYAMYSDPHGRMCIGRNNRQNEICKAVGGVLYSHRPDLGANVNYYRLP